MTEPQKRHYNELVEYYSNNRAEICSGDRAGATIMMEMRKLANHPLLQRYYFSDEKLREFSKRLASITTYKKTNPQYIFEELAVMSDFQVYQLCKKHVSSFVFKTSLKKYSIPIWGSLDYRNFMMSRYLID